MKARLNWVASSVMYDNNYCLEVTIGNKTFYKTLKGNKVIYFEDIFEHLFEKDEEKLKSRNRK